MYYRLSSIVAQQLLFFLLAPAILELVTGELANVLATPNPQSYETYEQFCRRATLFSPLESCV